MQLKKEQVSWLNGALNFLSMSMGDQPYDYLYSLELCILDKNDLIKSYAAFRESRKWELGKTFGDDDDYSYLQKVNQRAFTKYIRTAFSGRIGNEYHMIWKITDEFDHLYLWEMPDELYVCDFRRRLTNQHGQIFFIPAGEEILVSTWLCRNGLLD